MELPHHGLQVICSEDDYDDSYKTECDLLLIEYRIAGQRDADPFYKE